MAWAAMLFVPMYMPPAAKGQQLQAGLLRGKGGLGRGARVATTFAPLALSKPTAGPAKFSPAGLGQQAAAAFPGCPPRLFAFAAVGPCLAGKLGQTGGAP